MKRVEWKLEEEESIIICSTTIVISQHSSKVRSVLTCRTVFPLRAVERIRHACVGAQSQLTLTTLEGDREREEEIERGERRSEREMMQWDGDKDWHGEDIDAKRKRKMNKNCIENGRLIVTAQESNWRYPTDSDRDWDGISHQSYRVRTARTVRHSPK